MGTRNRKSPNRYPRRGRPPRSLFLGRQLLRLNRGGMKYRDLTKILREMRGQALPTADPSHPTWFQTPRRHVRDADAWERLHEEGLKKCDACQRGEISEDALRRWGKRKWWPVFTRTLLTMRRDHDEVLTGKIPLLDSRGRAMNREQVLTWSEIALWRMVEMVRVLYGIGVYPSQSRELAEIAELAKEVKALRRERLDSPRASGGGRVPPAH